MRVSSSVYGAFFQLVIDKRDDAGALHMLRYSARRGGACLFAAMLMRHAMLCVKVAPIDDAAADAARARLCAARFFAFVFAARASACRADKSAAIIYFAIIFIRFTMMLARCFTFSVRAMRAQRSRRLRHARHNAPFLFLCYYYALWRAYRFRCAAADDGLMLHYMR